VRERERGRKREKCHFFGWQALSTLQRLGWMDGWKLTTLMNEYSKKHRALAACAWEDEGDCLVWLVWA